MRIIPSQLLEKWSISQKGILLFCAFLVLQIFICSIILYEISLRQTREYLQKTTKRVQEDIRYKDGKWDTSLYNADSIVPDINPLYVITSTGFVIERWRPIHGLLDFAEFTRLLSYTQPETINTITNENWRILSRPVTHDGATLGVITVAAYKPEENSLSEIDKQLEAAISGINADLILQGDTIDVSKVDARKLPYTITFQVVNRFNKLLIQNNNTSTITRSPTFIDSSYIDNQIKNKEKQIEDTVTQQTYLTLTTPIYDERRSVVGIIVVGSPIDNFLTFVNKYTLLPTIVTSALLLLFLPFFIRHNKQQVYILAQKLGKKRDPKQILFSKKDCKLSIDDYMISIPYASYQYYFCEALFSKPNKRWEVDELLEKFGEQIGSNKWHKIYDTMTLINKKASSVLNEKLFITANKTYRLNPKYSHQVISAK